jgi:RNA polymerase sigma factor (sigma-70 family)
VVAKAGDLDEERRAVGRAQAGDLRALEPVLAAHAEALFSSVILPRLGHRPQAEDLLKDTLVTAIEQIGSFEWQGRSLFFWLRQIALRKIIDAHRARGRARAFEEALIREATQAVEVAPADDALIAEQDRRRAAERIEAALAALPERYAAAIRLRLIRELPREECARELGVQVATFDVVLFRAVRAFRKVYGGRDDG